MTVAELLGSAYAWAAGNAGAILVACLAVPGLGTLFAWIGKRGRSDADGRWVASACVGLGLGLVVFEVLAVLVARYAFHASLLDASLALLLAPLACLGAALAGMRLLFPLGELASVRAAADVGILLLFGAVLLWLLSKFRGWGFLFLGSLADFAVIAILALELLRRLARRAAGGAPLPAAVARRAP